MLLRSMPDARFDKGFLKPLQKQINTYFEGAYVDFRNIPIELEGIGSFFGSVLKACRNVEFGRTITYAGLAEKINRPAAVRAVGNALAKNPLPLIIPCHRVVRSDGKIGGFSAVGGPELKAKLLKHEQQSQFDSQSS
ncbi:MAG: methylated-DNA--[protein]-cysteine S-methyltransferase [Phycisphaerae bacterium]|nr:methylated-DNA--[protein]-cysteine S-methyltransferase [Phycisphaerae bacterium]